MAVYLFRDYNWGWNVGMMFGCILSATDPVAVVSLLRELGETKEHFNCEHVIFINHILICAVTEMNVVDILSLPE